MADLWNPGGSFNPQPSGLELEREDCPHCGLPTLTGLVAYVRRPIRLDAMPLRAWQEGQGLAGAGVLYETYWPTYVEHTCLLDLEAARQGVLTCRKCRGAGTVRRGILSWPLPCPKCQPQPAIPPRMGQW